MVNSYGEDLRGVNEVGQVCNISSRTIEVVGRCVAS
jgi:hypothetical protein